MDPITRDFYEERRRKWRRSAFWRGFLVAAVIAGVLFAIGINRLDARNLAPHETIRQLEKDKDTVKGMVR